MAFQQGGGGGGGAPKNPEETKMRRMAGAELSPSLKGNMWLGENIPAFKVGIGLLKDKVKKQILDPWMADIAAFALHWWLVTIKSSYEFYQIVKTTTPESIPGILTHLDSVSIDDVDEIKNLKCKKVQYVRHSFLKTVPICCECIKSGQGEDCPMRPIDDFLHDLSDEIIPFKFEELEIDNSWIKDGEIMLRNSRKSLAKILENSFMSYSDWRFLRLSSNQIRTLMYTEIENYLVDWYMDVGGTIA